MSTTVPGTLRAALSALAERRWTAQGLCEWALERSRACAPWNAFVEIDDQGALAAARAADRLRQGTEAGGDAALPPLLGLPLAHKDLFYRPGRAPGCGSRAPAPQRPGSEATVIARLRQAGALDLGALHLSEFAYGPTGHNAALGPARNPWQPDHVTGGSSSGSAVAVAAGCVWASLGSDSGGSIRTPASWCGVSGLKPTRGAISASGCMPLSPTMDTVGLMARSADDLALLFALLSGPDALDPATRGAPVWDAGQFADLQTRTPRLGIVDRWFYEDLSDAMAEGMDRVRAAWAALPGARVVAADIPGLGDIVRHARTVLLGEAWRTHQPLLERHDSLYSPGVRARLLAGAEIEAAALQAARAALPALLAGTLERAFADADVLLLPCNPTTAPRIDLTDVGAMPDPGPEVLRQVDGITRCLRPFNYLGLPSLVLPAGCDAQGLPYGFQLVGRPFEEARLLALGLRWQSRSDWHLRTPPGTGWTA